MSTRHPDSVDGTCAACARFHGDEHGVLEHVQSEQTDFEQKGSPGPVRGCARRRRRRVGELFPSYRWLG
jgi:hypothetical protein